MRSHFRGCNKLVTIMPLPIFFFLLLLGAPVSAGRENPLVESSSREELVQMAGYGEEKLSTVLISGSVLCESCSDHHHQKAPSYSLPVSGALVAFSCQTSGKTCKSNWVEATTDEFGDFLIDLPSHLHAIPNLDKRCLVKVLKLPKDSLCHPAFTGQQIGLKLSSVANGIRIYTAKDLHLTRKPSHSCMNKGEVNASVKVY